MCARAARAAAAVDSGLAFLGLRFDATSAIESAASSSPPSPSLSSSSPSAAGAWSSTICGLYFFSTSERTTLPLADLGSASSAKMTAAAAIAE